MSTPRFLFHASAVGLSGEIRRPFQQNIDCQASTALPRHGGHAKAAIKSFELGGVVAHSGVFTEVTGRTGPNTFETTVQAGVTGLNLEGKLKAQVLMGVIHSSHPARYPEKGEDAIEPAISLAGTTIIGLEIGGHEIELRPLFDFSAPFTHTMTGLREYYEKDTGFRQALESAAYSGKEEQLPEEVRKFFPWRRRQPSAILHRDRKMTILPLYTVVKAGPGLEVYGNVIRVPNFGRVHIGELIIERNRRRLLMLHADLGSPCEGTVNCSCADGNGTTDPPPDGD